MKFVTGHSFLPYSLSFIKDMTLARLCPALGKGCDNNGAGESVIWWLLVL